MLALFIIIVRILCVSVKRFFYDDVIHRSYIPPFFR